jgi:hypothetical protein
MCMRDFMLLEGENLLDCKTLKGLSIVDIVLQVCMTGRYHVMWTIHFLSTNHSSSMTISIQLKMTWFTANSASLSV